MQPSPGSTPSRRPTTSRSTWLPSTWTLACRRCTADATVTVWSTQATTTTHSNLGPVPGVKLTLYSLIRPPATGAVIGSQQRTDSNGQDIYTGLPYGLYVWARNPGPVRRAELRGLPADPERSMYSSLPIPSPTPTPKPIATPKPGSTGNETSSGGFLGIPGFEACSGTDRAAGRGAVPEKSLNRLPSTYFSFSVRFRS